MGHLEKKKSYEKNMNTMGKKKWGRSVKQENRMRGTVKQKKKHDQIKKRKDVLGGGLGQQKKNKGLFRDYKEVSSSSC